MSNPKTFSKLFIGLAFFLMIFFVFNLGIDAAKADGKEAVVDGVQSLFWFIAFVLFSKMNSESDKLDRELEKAHDDFHKSIGDLLGTVEKDMKERQGRREKFVSIFKEVTGKDFYEAKTVSSRHKAAIERKFNEATGLFAHIEVKSGGKIGVNVTDVKPQPATPTTKKAPVKKSVVAKTVAQIPKPPVVKKSNAKKGNK